jgi:hypothetical protein
VVNRRRLKRDRDRKILFEERELVKKSQRSFLNFEGVEPGTVVVEASVWVGESELKFLFESKFV